MFVLSKVGQLRPGMLMVCSPRDRLSGPGILDSLKAMIREHASKRSADEP
jgi:hypothetical protein